MCTMNGNGNNVNRVIRTVSRFCVSRTRRKAGEAVVVWGGGFSIPPPQKKKNTQQHNNMYMLVTKPRNLQYRYCPLQYWYGLQY